MDVSLLKHPKNSHRKKVKLPECSALFAEFVGIMLGDGGINNDWQATITVNALADKDYADYVVSLCVQLFGVVPAMRKRKTKQAVVISLASTSVVDFLVSQGLPRGNKLAGVLQIPGWILADSECKRACVRGLVDTDGCLYIHKHRVGGKEYKNIGFCFTNYSPTLIKQVAEILAENGIRPSISNKDRSIYLYRASSVKEYLRMFGSSNERIISVYKKLEASDSGLFHRLGKAAWGNPSSVRIAPPPPMAVKFLLVSLLVVASIAVIGFFRPKTPPKVEEPSLSTAIIVGGTAVAVEIADTALKRAQGLSGREGLAENSGMLFIFGRDGYWGIWMKDMRFAIDILWADAEGNIVTIARAIAPETYPQVFKPDAPARYVLEVQAGFTQGHAIVEGMKIEIGQEKAPR